MCSNTCISSSSLLSVPRSHLHIYGQPLYCSMVSKNYLETILALLFLGSTSSQLTLLVLLKQNSLFLSFFLPFLLLFLPLFSFFPFFLFLPYFFFSPFSLLLSSLFSLLSFPFSLFFIFFFFFFFVCGAETNGSWA